MNYKDLLNDKDREIFNSIWSSNVWNSYHYSYEMIVVNFGLSGTVNTRPRGRKPPFL